ncbi:TetR/AcrR family transcriptional regulator [Arenibaculum pallidiluteum]|uniref:TetR/AcrR family transcriptional regulator n=1 Tax=Arenibaculum pallidiluteum TaxID=2812559 RepID=UPI001A9730A6|nr:TetR/AcrR family transcriptional regulator [Arenibaculum pallidiluteum]
MPRSQPSAINPGAPAEPAIAEVPATPPAATQPAAAEPRRARQRKRLPPEERRLQIVQAAVAFFAEVGLEGRTRDLSSRLGITQSLLYKYFDSKESLLDAVFEHVYLGRLSPEWPALLRDRSLPLKERIFRFYCEYTDAIFRYEWLRIFMFSGLTGEKLNARYFTHLQQFALAPLMDEIQAAAQGERRPDMEDIWNLHGSIVYLGIRKHIYQTPTPDDVRPVIERAIDRLLRDFGIETGPPMAGP